MKTKQKEMGFLIISATSYEIKFDLGISGNLSNGGNMFRIIYI